MTRTVHSPFGGPSAFFCDASSRTPEDRSGRRREARRTNRSIGAGMLLNRRLPLLRAGFRLGQSAFPVMNGPIRFQGIAGFLVSSSCFRATTPRFFLFENEARSASWLQKKRQIIMRQKNRRSLDLYGNAEYIILLYLPQIEADMTSPLK